MVMTDLIYERDGEYIRNPSKYFVDRCINTRSDYGRDFDAIVNDLRQGYDGGMSLPALVQRFVGPSAKVTQDNVRAAIRGAFTQLYESGDTCIDSGSDVQSTFDMLLACHPKFDEKFGSYLPGTYELDKDQYGNWTVTVTGRKEFIVYSDGDYLVVDAEDVVDDVSWVKIARNAARMFKGCAPHEAGFGRPVASVVRNDTMDALRKAVDDQISEHRCKHRKAHNGKYVDVVDGKTLSPLDSHVDHYPISFARLVDMWFAEQQYGFEDIAIEATVGEFNGVMMSNDAQCRSWQDFHREHAALRVVSKERNLSSRHH